MERIRKRCRAVLSHPLCAWNGERHFDIYEVYAPVMVRYRRKLIQLGNKSLVMTIPWEIVHELGLEKGERVYVSLDERTSRVIIERGAGKK
ncbi:MAG: hypothetical protein AB1665_04695 [Candidatus Thermoplasmatota archaeon]